MGREARFEPNGSALVSMRELKTWRAHCDWYTCGEIGPVVLAEDEPDPPKGWGYFTSGGWGMTGYTNTELLCPQHLAQATERAA